MLRNRLEMEQTDKNDYILSSTDNDSSEKRLKKIEFDYL